MAMSELKQKMLLHELAQVGFPDAVYIPQSDTITLQPDGDRLPIINDAGDVKYGTEYSYLAINTIRPLVEKVNEPVTAWERSAFLPIENVSHFKALAEYNNVVLAARDDTDLGRGLHFVTWRYNHNRTDVESGVYTENYNAAKESFAARSGLVPQDKLFTQEQVLEMKTAIDYRIAHDGGLAYAIENELKSIASQLHMAYPEAEADKQNELNEQEHNKLPIDESSVAESSTAESSDAKTMDVHAPEDVHSGGQQNHMHSQLMERINQNLSDYHEHLEGFGNRELIVMAGAIAAMTGAHDYLIHYHTFTDDELECLLRFNNKRNHKIQGKRQRGDVCGGGIVGRD